MFPIKLILGILTEGYYQFDMTKPQLDLKTLKNNKFWLLSYWFRTLIKLKLSRADIQTAGFLAGASSAHPVIGTVPSLKFLSLSSVTGVGVITQSVSFHSDFTLFRNLKFQKINKSMNLNLLIPCKDVPNIWHELNISSILKTSPFEAFSLPSIRINFLLKWKQNQGGLWFMKTSKISIDIWIFSYCMVTTITFHWSKWQEWWHYLIYLAATLLLPSHPLFPFLKFQPSTIVEQNSQHHHCP